MDQRFGSHRVRIASFATLLLIASTARACFWDSDTLRNEAKNFPDLIDVATGRFERFPPQYYKIRLDRVTAELKARLEKLSNFDDAAVACDRLGNDNAALAWMQKKRLELKSLGGENDDATYKLLSNEGTFYLLKWFKNRRDLDDLSLLDKSLADLRAGVRLNPNAHFGREAIQIGFVEWLKLVTKNPNEHPYLPRNDPRQPVDLYTYLTKRKWFSDGAIQKGLSGLVVLGAAWESPDVFAGILETVPRRLGVLSRFIDDRIEELVSRGIPRLMVPEPEARYTATDQIRPSVDASFRLFRKAADDENSRRTEYMTVRMDQGRHPDTDPTFWNEWRPRSRPDFIDPPLLVRMGTFNMLLFMIGSLILAIIGLRWRDVRRRRLGLR